MGSFGHRECLGEKVEAKEANRVSAMHNGIAAAIECSNAKRKPTRAVLLKNSRMQEFLLVMFIFLLLGFAFLAGYR
jgi:hypothetical protein